MAPVSDKRFNPQTITQSLGVKVFRRVLRRSWTPQEDQRLLRLLEQMHPGEFKNQNLDAEAVDWDVVAREFVDEKRRSQDCKKRWRCTLDPNITRGKWTAQEDAQLQQLYEKFGPDWHKVATEVPGRTDCQCLKRWWEFLDPGLSNKLKEWSQEEDLALIELVEKYGTKWKTLAANFDGRASLALRNRWRAIVTAVARGRASPSIRAAIERLGGDYKLAGDFKIADKKPLAPLTLTPESPASDLHSAGGYANGQQPPEYSRSQPAPKHADGRFTSQIDWRYRLDAENPPADIKPLLAHGGAISLQELARYLVEYAMENNVEIAVHQHIHHYEASPAQIDSLDAPYDSRSIPYDLASQTTRFQHFHYLPPLTEVPRLTSSSAGGDDVLRASTQHHHHHHHHHVLHEKHSASAAGDSGTHVLGPDHEHEHDHSLKRGLDAQAASFHLAAQRSGTKASGQLEGAGTADSRQKSMSPLSQAAHMVQSAGKRRTNVLAGSDAKKPRLDANPDEDDEDAADFFESIRNIALPMDTSRAVLKNVHGPVSQHHPLHYHMSSVTPQPEDIDEEDEEFHSIYGLFCNVYPREPTDVPEDRPYGGVIPFNPS